MILCQMPECQTTAGCKCSVPMRHRSPEKFAGDPEYYPKLVASLRAEIASLRDYIAYGDEQDRASRLTRQEDETRRAALEERKDRERQIRVSEMRYVVTFLHEFAAEMNDPTAKAVLNLAADNWGRARSRALKGAGHG